MSSTVPLEATRHTPAQILQTQAAANEQLRQWFYNAPQPQIVELLSPTVPLKATRHTPAQILQPQADANEQLRQWFYNAPSPK
ncbi:hypothetical protein, partial [Stieleria mannarensis]|uniref:hypothetical protein n=1 Tax=Stieleria mannarensis TaxID=2755585 RepID=UPI001C722643